MYISLACSVGQGENTKKKFSISAFSTHGSHFSLVLQAVRKDVLIKRFHWPPLRVLSHRSHYHTTLDQFTSRELFFRSGVGVVSHKRPDV